MNVKPIQYQMPRAEELPGLSTATIREFRGLNTFDPLSIGDSYFTDISNLSTDDYPAISTRPGHTVLGSALGTRVTGLGVWKGQRLIGAFNDGTWRVWNGSSWSAPILTVTSTDPNVLNAPWTFTNFQGAYSDINLIGSNGTGKLVRYDGNQTHFIDEAPAGGNFVTTYQNRLWVAFGKEIRACKLDNAEVWNDFSGTEEDSYGKTIESTHGENINALSSGLKKLTIGMPNSIVELYGSLPSDFYTISVSEDMGTVNNRSTFTQEGVLRFMHSTGLYEYSGGIVPDKVFSETIKGYSAVTDQAAAGSDGRHLFFTTTADVTLVYDPALQTWGVWRGLAPTCYAVMGNDLYIGDNAGRVLKVGGSSDNGAPIAWHAVTKPFTSSAIAQRQRWLKLWLSVEMAAGSKMNIYLSESLSGDSDWELVKSLVGVGRVGVQRALVPVDKIALANHVRIKFEGTGWVRIHEHTRQQRSLPLY